MEKWMMCNKAGDFEGIMNEFGLSMIGARLLVNRGITGHGSIKEFLDPDISMLHSPFLLADLERAADCLVKGISEGKSVRVVGDYDVDGIMAVYILTDALGLCGCRVDWYIPHRIKDGYGINTEMIASAVNDGIDIIVTCDNGIAAFDAADDARKNGITMIITDHHEVQDRLPDCDIIVDPKRPDDTYPCKDICGAVVAAKLAQALFEKKGLNIPQDHYLEFMAMATVCDVVKLIGENRVIVKKGIKKLINTPNPGLSALIDEKGIDRANLSEYHIGFVLGPCFNATGRIDDAGVALKMLTGKDRSEAVELARQCVQLNEERKEMTAREEAKAVELVDSLAELPKVIVVELEGCHESILGIIAGRLKEHYSRPAIAATKSADGYKASGRSTENYNIFEELKKCSDLLVRFGGHPMAAGLTIRENCFDEFRDRLNGNCELSEADMYKKVLLDLEVSFNIFNLKNVEEISLFAPFGQGNPSPLFGERNLKVKGISYIGRDNSFLKFVFENAYGHTIVATLFSNAAETVDALKEKYGEDQVAKAFGGRQNDIVLTAAYVPKINTYHDIKELQMNIKYLKL